MEEIGFILLLLGGLASSEPVTYTRNDAQFTYGEHVHFQDLALKKGINVIFAQQFEVHHSMKLVKNDTKIVVFALDISAMEHIDLKRVSRRVSLCGNVHERITHYNQDCSKILTKSVGKAYVEGLVTNFLESIQSADEKAAIALWLRSYVPDHTLVLDWTLQYLLSQIKLTSGLFIERSSVSEEDLMQLLIMAMKKLEPYSESLLWKNQYVHGLSYLCNLALENDLSTLEMPDLNTVNKAVKHDHFWQLLKSSDKKILLKELAKNDMNGEAYITVTEWDALSNSLFSFAWTSEDFETLDKHLQRTVVLLKEIYHLRSLIMAKRIDKFMMNPTVMIEKDSKDRFVTISYNVEQALISELKGRGFKTTIRPRQNPQFANFSYHAVEDIKIYIDGIGNENIELSALNLLARSSMNYNQTESGVPVHYYCTNNGKCDQFSNIQQSSPFTEWLIKLSDNHKLGSNSAHDIRIDFVLSIDSLRNKDFLETKREHSESNVTQKKKFDPSNSSWSKTVPRDKAPSAKDRVSKNYSAAIKVDNFVEQPVECRNESLSYNEKEKTMVVDKLKTQVDDDYTWVKNKYGFHSPIYLFTDILMATDLDQMNILYENLHQTGDGVVTYLETPSFLFQTIECMDFVNPDAPPDFRPITVKRYIKAIIGVRPPKFHFLKNNENTVRLTWELDDSSFLEYKMEGIPCDDLGPWTPPSYKNVSIHGASIQAVISLRVLHGSVTDGFESGGIILDLPESAFTPEHFTFECEECKDDIFYAIKDTFVKEMTSISLSTIQYNPAVTPKIVRPDQFSFQTVCPMCNEDIDSKGYLIVYVCTQAGLFSSCRYGELDPVQAGFDEATPPWHSTIILLASHLLWEDIILPSWNEGGKFTYNVETYVDPQASVKEANLCMKFANSITANFPNDQGTISIPADTFNLTANIDGLRVQVNYENLALNMLVKVNRSNCHFSWWDIFTLGITFLIRCCVVEHVDRWKSGHLTIRGDQAANFQYRPQCYSFQFDATEVAPEVRFEVPGLGSDQDRDALNAVRSSTESELRQLLQFRAAKSQDVSLFAAANILFPSSKILDISGVFLTGDLIMLGDLSKSYDPSIDDLDLINGLPEECYV